MLKSIMEKSVIIVLFHIGFGFWDVCTGLPIDFSSVGTGKLNAIWLTSSLLLAVGFLIGIVSLIIGCICCRNGRGFQEFSNSNGCLTTPVVDGFVNPTATSEITIFPPFGITSNVSSRSSVVQFEPLPNIKPQAPNLRPAAFSYSEQEISSQDWFYDPYNNFPRSQLKYVQEYGKGWFGRVVEGEAQNIVNNEKVSKVIVKILHEDATPTDQMYFLHEVKFYRDLKHPNILSLLGRCLETEPFLILLESCPNGDLKSFLTQNMVSAQALVEQGITLRMCSNITAGLQYMHENKFIHTDLAARNCLVSPDLTVKIGDYGNSIEVFKSDYYCAGSVALPVRWCAPETLKCTDVTIETKEVTPVANVWTLAIVIWEICEFCKLPYEELNDDQVIVRVLGDKNYFLQIPKMFCLYKDELYHLMKLCWSPPLQRPTAAQIGVILGNLLSSKGGINEEGLDPRRFSQDFEQRWQKSKPNYIPKKDNASEADESSHFVTTKFKGAKVADSSYMESPLGVFMSNKSIGQDSPRFCLKNDKMKGDKRSIENHFSDLDIVENKSNFEAEEYFDGLKKSDSVKNLTGSLDRLNTLAQEFQENGFKVDFDYSAEVKSSQILNSNCKSTDREIDSWLKGVEVNNEEDETFVRKVSEAIRDLDAALAMEKTSSSEENSCKSSHQSSPGKETKENENEDAEAVVVDFKLGGDTTTSFINFIPKTFELSSLQNSEEPQSLNFNNTMASEKRNDFSAGENFQNYEQASFVNPTLNDPRNSLKFKNLLFDESLKGNDSFLNAQSRNSSDTEDEVWRRRIERGEFSEKVKEKSKSIANLMILTHIDASDDSDVDLDRSFDRSLNRNSYSRRHYSNHPKSSLSSTNFGSENNLTNAVLEDNFKESLRKLSNDHKEYGRFDSLGMILPSSVDRENLWGNILRKSNSEENVAVNSTGSENVSPKNAGILMAKDPSDNVRAEIDPFVVAEKNSDSRNNFLGNTASEKLGNHDVMDNEEQYDCNSASSNNLEMHAVNIDVDFNSPVDEPDRKLENSFNCDNSKIESESTEKPVFINGSSQKNDSAKCEIFESGLSYKDVKRISSNFNVECKNDKSQSFMTKEQKQGEIITENGGNDSVINVMSIVREALCHYEAENTVPELMKGKLSFEELSLKELKNDKIAVPEDTSDFFVTESPTHESHIFPSKDDLIHEKNNPVPEIKITEPKELDPVQDEPEMVEYEIPKIRPFKFVLKNKLGGSELCTERNTRENDADLMLVKDKLGDKNAVELPNCTDNVILLKDSVQCLSQKRQNGEESGKDDVQVIIGACEDYTLDYFKGLKTTFGNAIDNVPDEKAFNHLIPEVTINKDVNLDVWDKHLEKSITQMLDNTDFDEINFFNVNIEPQGKDDYTDVQIIASDSSVSTSPNTSISNAEGGEENLTKEEKKSIEDPLNSSSGFTTVNGNTSEEEYENNKLRTPDDERSSDSGFRDKGSLSESVEDACEGKYNLEDIEAELEEAYVKGAFSGREADKKETSSSSSSSSSTNPSQNNNNFEYEETKFYEDENKNSDDFSDIDGEIEFWQNHENGDYYSEISEFSPTSMNSLGWYLHPPEENFYMSNANVNEEFVNALRDELRQKLPMQSRSFHEFNDNYDNLCFENSEDEKTSKCTGSFSVALSPILEEQDHSLCNNGEEQIYFRSQMQENTLQKGRKNLNIMESGKLVDTNAFMHYLDYMVETEGKDKDMEGRRVIFGRDGETRKPYGIAFDFPDRVDTRTMSEQQDKCDASVKCEGPKDTESVILVVDTETNKATLKENSELEADYEIENNADRLIFIPDSGSPDRDRTLSDPSRSSNGSRSGDVSSEITISSPDLLSECYLTPTSVNSPFESPNHSSQEIIEKDKLPEDNGLSAVESNQEEDEFEGDDLDGQTVPSENLYSREAEEAYEMSTSFMGDNPSDDSNGEMEDNISEMTVEQKKTDSHEKSASVKTQEASYNEWESLSSGGEDEMSSSSGEFIWKDGERESKVKVRHVSDNVDIEPLFQNSGPDRENKQKHEFAEEANKKSSGREEGDENDYTDEDDNNRDFTDSEDDRDGSSTGSSASITDFVPSAWNSQATPSRPALRSPDKKTENQKRNVWFKKQKYHCIYEYPREPSDTESANNSPQKHFTYGIDSSEMPNKYFTYGINNPKVNLTNKYFTYGISDLLDYSNYMDWDNFESEEGEIPVEEDSLMKGGSEVAKANKKTSGSSDFYNLNSFDYDFNGSNVTSDDEFFVSSSARPFQGGTSSQFFPNNGNNSYFPMFKELQISNDGKTAEVDAREERNPVSHSSLAFVIPEAEPEEDMINQAVLQNKTDGENVREVKKTTRNREIGVAPGNDVFDDLKFSFIHNKSTEEVDMVPEAFGENDSSNSNDLSTLSLNSPSSPLSPIGLGELRHARDKLKLDLPINHNIELNLSVGKNNSQVEEVTQN